ncbi:MAG: hypothetical protein ACI81L_001346 [Verrucomicrobiales bacterium]
MTVTLTTPEVRSAWVASKRAVPALGLAGVCLAAAFTEVASEEGQVLCPYRLVTGGWCPGCGCTRALGALMHGDLRGSLLLNPWTVLVLAQVAFMATWILGAPEAARSWWRRNDYSVLKINMAVAGIIWIARLAAGVIPLPF